MRVAVWCAAQVRAGGGGQRHGPLPHRLLRARGAVREADAARTVSAYWPGTSSYTLSPILSDGLLGVGCVYVSNRFLRQLTRIAEEFGVAVVLTNQARPPQQPSPAPPHKCTTRHGRP